MAADKKEIDALTGTDTTGHDWDGIKELDTPLPRWWLWTFYATIVWGVGYTIFYPAWPLVSDATAGILGYTTRGAVAEQIASAAEAQRVYTDRIAEMELAAIADDPDLMRFAFSGGAAIFRTNCSQCHGAGAAGVQAAGYPNLLDDAWLWGGSVEDIHYSIVHGIRNEDDLDARYSEMPAFGADEILTDEEIGEVADYVLSLSGTVQGTEDGAILYAENCAACHGDNGGGMPEVGAPNLADAIWLYGGSRDKVVETITYSRYGVMPAWGLRLTEAQTKQVALYVHSLGGGE
ncbi:MAG: cytochrome-c oxidase, cbb3-type subunit III [Pseudomonadota bacterium]